MNEREHPGLARLREDLTTLREERETLSLTAEYVINRMLMWIDALSSTVLPRTVEETREYRDETKEAQQAQNQRSDGVYQYGQERALAWALGETEDTDDQAG